jgi:hypothetical protein
VGDSGEKRGYYEYRKKGGSSFNNDLIVNGDFTWKYFTVDDGQIRLGSGDKYIVIGTIEAYNKFCAYFGKDAILPIYIEVDDGIRLMRAINREQKQEVPQYEEMCRRFLADSKDFSEEKIKEAGINQRFSNDGTIEDCIRDIKEAIKQQLL